MKRTDRIKNIQLAIYVLLTLATFFLVLRKGVKGNWMSLLLWITMAISFFFIFLDFSNSASQQRDYNAMVEALRSDPATKLANRYSVDALIDRYADQALPAGFCCVAFEITNIREINEKFGRKCGNDVIRRFSIILKLAALDRYFIGRNGGCRFVAMSQGANIPAIRLFLQRLNEQVSAAGEDPDCPAIAYQVGIALLEENPEQDIFELLASSNRHIGEPHPGVPKQLIIHTASIPVSSAPTERKGAPDHA